MSKSLQEKAKELGKILLIESSYLQVDQKNIEIPKDGLLIESEGKAYKARAVLRNVPISKYTENFNGRLYSIDLWKKVKESKSGEGSLCLMGHPEDSGSPSLMAGVRTLDRIGDVRSGSLLTMSHWIMTCITRLARRKRNRGQLFPLLVVQQLIIYTPDVHKQKGKKN